MNERSLLPQKHSAAQIVTISVIGVSGCERLKGSVGVGKSLICNRFVRGDFDRFKVEHSSILSQTDFCGSPVINSDHWIYWGDRYFNSVETSPVQVRLIEQTEFIDDETFEPFECSSAEYPRRATKVKLESPDKLMYICREQLGIEAEYEHVALPEGRAQVDGFIFVYDISVVEGRTFDCQSNVATEILQNVVKTKKPVVIAASKVDIGVETGKKALRRILTRKEFKSSNLNVVEVSSIANVNVTSLFALIVAFAIKSKTKSKPLPFHEAFKLQNNLEQDARDQYVSLLREVMPIERWPQLRPSWSKLLCRTGMNKHPSYQRFVYYFGQTDAIKLYQKHVDEAREFWMQRRLQVQIPRLHHVFHQLIRMEVVKNLSWIEAKSIICNHPLFDEYFKPLGSLGADLEPSSPQIVVNPDDFRIAAEVLLTTDAEPTFLQYKDVINREYQLELQQEAFECLLSQCPQVAPGKPLQEVEIFLTGDPVFDSIPIEHVLSVYENYQVNLVKKVKKDFGELLLETVQTFLVIILLRIKTTHSFRPLIGIDDEEMSSLRAILSDDIRYRQLSRLFEIRDEMICNYLSFVSYPLVQNCPAGGRCIDALLTDIMNRTCQKLTMVKPPLQIDINLLIVGDERLYGEFVSGLTRILQNGSVEYKGQVGQICYKRMKEFGHNSSSSNDTCIYLVDSLKSLEDIKHRFDASEFQCPPLVVLVADPAHLDIIPFLRQQASVVASNMGGIFIAPMSDLTTRPRQSSENELNAFFTRDQICRVLEAAFRSQTDARLADLRIQVSLMCGDQFPAHCVLNSLLFNSGLCSTSTSGDTATIEVTIPSLKKRVRIDVRVSPYHSWLVTNVTLPVHGHILVYSARRRASYSHAKVAANRLVSSGYTTGERILFVAVADVTDFFNNPEANALLTEGSELAEELKSFFISLSPEMPDHIHSVSLLEFFERILAIHSMKSSMYSNGQCYAASSRDTLSNDSVTTSCCHLSPSMSSKDFNSSNCTSRSHESTSSSRGSCRQSMYSNSPYSLANFSSKTPVKKSMNYMHYKDFSSLSPSKLVQDVDDRSSFGIGGVVAILQGIEGCVEKQFRGEKTNGAYLSQSMKMLNDDHNSLIHAPNGHYPALFAAPEYIEIANEYTSVKDAINFDDEDDDMSIYETMKFAMDTESCGRNDEAISQVHQEGNVERASGEDKTMNAVKNDESSSSALPNYQIPVSDSHVKSALFLPVPQLAKPHNEEKKWHIPVPLVAPMSAHVMRRLHSISAESLIDAGLMDSSNYYARTVDDSSISVVPSRKKNSKAKFVRKMASTIRFRKGSIVSCEKGSLIAEEVEEEYAETGTQNKSRSAPHSPRAEQLYAKSRDQPSAACSDKISNAISWFPARLPKRSDRTATNGVLSKSDTLRSLASRSDDGVPYFVKKCIECIEKEGGLEIEGLYRVPGNQAHVVKLERLFLEDCTVDLLSAEMPVHTVATALKNFLSGLPEPLIPYNSHEALVKCLNEKTSEIIPSIRKVIDNLPDANRKTLLYLGKHLSRVVRNSGTNSMDVRNLAKVWWPTLFRPNFKSFESMAVFVDRLEMATQFIFLSIASAQ